MAESFLDLIDTGSINEAVVKARQNKVEVVAAKALSDDVNQDAAIGVQKIKDNANIQKSADEAEIAFRNTVNVINDGLQQEIQGTNNTLAAFNKQYEETYTQYQQAIADSSKLSFWSHPIASIRNSVVQDNLKSKLNTVTQAINSGNSHIDDSYARAAQKVNDYKASVMNLNQAELMAKAHEVQAGYDAAKITIDAKTKTDTLAQQASRAQQFKADDPYDKARAAEDKAVMEDQVLRYKWKVTNNYVDVPYTKEAGKLMKQSLENSSPAEKDTWGKAAARYYTSATMPRLDGETAEQHSQRQLRVDIGRAGEVDGPEFARVVSGATNTIFNPLFKLADQEVEATIGTVDYDKWAQDHGVMGGAQMMKPEQIRLAQQEQRLKVAQISQKDRITMAGDAIGRDMTLTATKNTVPPFKFAEASTLVAASGASNRTVEFFQSDAAKLALENPTYVTGDTKKDTVIALYQALDSRPNGGGTSKQISQIIASYIDAAYKADYSINGEHASEYQGLQQLIPNSAVNFQVPVTTRSGTAAPKVFDLRNPVDVESFIQRQKGIFTKAEQAQDIKEGNVRNSQYQIDNLLNQ